MSTVTDKGTTAVLAEWAAGFRLEHAPAAVVERMKALLDPEIEAGTNTEEVPSRVSVKLADGRAFMARVAHPRGSPHRVMNWEELSALFRDTVADALPADRLERVLALVAGLDRGTRAREITAAFVAVPGWLERDR